MGRQSSLEAAASVAKAPPAILYDEAHLLHQPSLDYQEQRTSQAGFTRLTGPSAQRRYSLRPPIAPMEQSSGPAHRFVAGEAFFNYETFGSLRPEFPPIRHFSSAFLGLAVNALIAGFVITLTKYGFRQVLGEFLRVNDNSYVTSVQFLLEWPGSFSLFLGFLSDCRPIGGRRRKPYMIIGWILACVLFAAVAIVDLNLARSWELVDWRNEPDSKALEEIRSRSRSYAHILLALAMLARLAVQLMYIASLSMTVEFAQRESLPERGKLQATYFVLFYIMAAVAQGITASFVLADEDEHYLDEPPVPVVTVHFSVRRRVHELWRFCHHNVVIRIISFLVIYFFIIGLYNKNARSAISKWCGITQNKIPAANAVDIAGYCVSLTIWIIFMVNWNWRRLAGIGSVVFLIGYVTFTSLVTFNVVRNDWFYIIVVAILDMPTAWLRLYAVVLSTEIADNGREGVTMGFVYAAQLMVGVSAHMVSAGLGVWLPFHVTDDDIRADSSLTRRHVFGGSMVVFAINCLSIAMVLVLPQQKLDAQQLRAFGGYNRYASYGVAVGFVLLFSANFVMNSLALAK